MQVQKKHFKNNLHPNNKIKHEIGYFMAGLDMETNKAASAETAQNAQWM